MNRTKIEWVRNPDGSKGYVWNPVTGCENGCPYCYARGIATRFKGTKAFPNGFAVTYHPERINEPYHIRKATRIFVCSMADLFGDWIDQKVVSDVLDTAEDNSKHTFIFLTKQPQNLQKWNFPENCWVGATATDWHTWREALRYLGAIPSITFISFEPLNECIPILGKVYHNEFLAELKCAAIGQFILGAETGNRKGKPPLEQVQGWAREIIKAADEAGIPVFIKDNLKLPANEVRREWPK